MIRIQSMSKFFPTRFGPKFVFRNVNIILPGDRDIAVLGPNGAGKSTFVNMMAGIDMPSAGSISSSKIISWPLGVSSGLSAQATGRENVRFVRNVLGQRSVQFAEEYVEDFAELGKSFDLPIATYSSGMRSRYNFAVSMAFDFDTYLIDEVMAVGDESFRRKCNDVLDSKRNGSNIVLVSHNMADIRRHCDAGILIANGRMDFYEDVQEAIWRYEHF